MHSTVLSSITNLCLTPCSHALHASPLFGLHFIAGGDEQCGLLLNRFIRALHALQCPLRPSLRIPYCYRWRHAHHHDRVQLTKERHSAFTLDPDFRQTPLNDPCMGRGISRKYSKPLVCISTLLHCVAYVTQPHTHIWRGCPTEVSMLHGKSFLALGFAYPLFYSLQSPPRDPTQIQDSWWIPLHHNWSATL